MVKIKRVLVALDLSGMDEVLIRYVARLSHLIDLEKVYFFNVMQNLEIPEKILEKYPDLVAPMDESTKKQITYMVENEAGNQLKAEYEIKVTDGHITEKILKWAKVKEADLIMMGRKSSSKGDGIYSGKVVKLAPCSVLLVPEQIPDQMDHIVVPIDFSPASKRAFDYVYSLATKNPETRVTCVHAFEVPSGYHMLGQSYEEFAGIMKANAEDEWNEFIKDYPKGRVRIDCLVELNEEGSRARKIYEVAKRVGASAIAVGSKGRTQAASMLLGSVAEKLIKYNTDIPQFVVKQPRYNMDFLEAWLGI